MIKQNYLSPDLDSTQVRSTRTRRRNRGFQQDAIDGILIVYSYNLNKDLANRFGRSLFNKKNRQKT